MSGIQGYYVDMKHGKCLRKITKLEDENYIIQGTYGDDEGDENTGKEWTASMTATDMKVLKIDFSKKKTAHGDTLFALWSTSDRCIFWEDGNVWFKLYAPSFV